MTDMVSEKRDTDFLKIRFVEKLLRLFELLLETGKFPQSLLSNFLETSFINNIGRKNGVYRQSFNDSIRKKAT